MSLKDAATQVRENAYAPYSRFKVGAALRTPSGAVHVGCNVENVAYPEGTCAEAGAMLMPAMPAFYQMPQTLDDLANFMAGKILAALGFEHELYPAWKG